MSDETKYPQKVFVIERRGICRFRHFVLGEHKYLFFEIGTARFILFNILIRYDKQ